MTALFGGCARIESMSPKRLEDMYDAVIVGAGAAGLSAALGLLRSPEIAELKRRPRYKALQVLLDSTDQPEPHTRM